MNQPKYLKSLTGEYSKLQPHHNISLSQNKLYGAVEIFMAVFIEKGAFFSLPLGLLGISDHILQNICLKLGRGSIFGPYAHFLLTKFFSKNLKFFSTS